MQQEKFMLFYFNFFEFIEFKVVTAYIIFCFVWGLLWFFEFLLMNLYFLINFFKAYFFWKTIW